jgi:DNA-binding NarL/FixJ family response regulator
MMAPRSTGSRRSGESSGEGIAVAIVSDDALYRNALERALVAGDLAVIAEVRTLGDLPFAGSEIDVLLLDARAPDALATCAALARESRPRVLLVAAPDDDVWAGQALDAGARGILPREGEPRDAISAIHIVHEGLIWARRRVITARIDQLASRISAAARSVDVLEQRLSIREREVFRYAATGLGNKQLARRLEISEATVKVHLTHIFQKLGVNGRAELAAAYHGIVQPSEPAE